MSKYEFKRYAKYTMQFIDAYTIEPTLLDFIKFTNEEDTEKFLKVFKGRWNIYEISGETFETFKLYLEDIFNQYIEYYDDLLKAYHEKINMLDGAKQTVSEHNSDIENVDETGNSNLTNGNYELPNKVTSQDYMTSKNTQDSNIKNNRKATNERDKTITITGGVNVIELKKKYMDLIRNIYLDFANRFTNCFIQMYD